MRKSLLLILLSCLSSIHAQIDYDKFRKGYEEETSNSQYDSIVKRLGYKAGDKLVVNAIFSIDHDGKIGDVRTRGPHPYFEDMARNILLNTPDLVPDNFELDPKSEQPKFSIPITFIIESEKKRAKKTKRKSKKKN